MLWVMLIKVDGPELTRIQAQTNTQIYIHTHHPMDTKRPTEAKEKETQYVGKEETVHMADMSALS